MQLSEGVVGYRELIRFGVVDNYHWHKKIWELFPEMRDEAREFLYRLDSRRDGVKLLLLSSSTPTFPDWGEWRSKVIDGAFLEHAQYQFQCRVNPTFRRKSDRRRIGLTREPEIVSWFERKAAAGGFEVAHQTLDVAAPRIETFSRKGVLGRHIAVDLCGHLEVTDRKKFIANFTKGVGPAKAFGFGLMMLKPTIF